MFETAIASGQVTAEALLLARARLSNGMHALAALAGVAGLRAVFDAEMVLIVDRFGDDGGEGRA
jgi:hypothetical protein